MNIVVAVLLFSILTGQLIKIPILGNNAPPLLDFIIIALDIVGLISIKFKLKEPPLFIKTGFLFSIVATISLILTPLTLNVQEIFTSFFYTIRFLGIILFGWLIYSGAYGAIKENISKLLIYSGVGLAILGLLQLFIFPDLSFMSVNGWDPHYFRLVSTFLDPNFTGAYLVLTLLLLYCHSRESGNLYNKLFKLVYIVVYLSLLLTFSRSSYGMFLVSFLSLSYFLKSWKMAFISILLFLGLIIGFQIYGQAVAKPRGISREQSASFRLNTWQQGLTILQNHPILGVGFNSYRFALKEYQLAPETVYGGRGGSTNDSSLLFVASTTGILGLISYMAFLISIFIHGLHTNKVLSIAILGLLAHSLFANSLFYPFIFIWIILIALSSKFLLETVQKK